MTTDFVHLDHGGTIIIHHGEPDTMTASYREWVHTVVLRYHETMALERVTEAERRLQELKEEG